MCDGDAPDTNCVPETAGSWWVFDTTITGDTGAPERKMWRIEPDDTNRDDGAVRLDVTGVKQVSRWFGRTGPCYVWRRNLSTTGDDATPVTDKYFDPPSLRFDEAPTLARWTMPPYTITEINVQACLEPDADGNPGPWRREANDANIAACDELRHGSVTVQPVEDERWSVVDVPADIKDVPGIDVAQAVCERRDCPTPDEGGPVCPSGTYCFINGVGKVFEETDQTDVLRSWCVAGNESCADGP